MIFTHLNNHNQPAVWVLVQHYSYANEHYPIDPRVYCPLVMLSEEYSIIPADWLRCRIHTIATSSFLEENEEDPASMWINWWVNRGDHRYPMEDYDQLTQQDRVPKD